MKELKAGIGQGGREAGKCSAISLLLRTAVLCSNWRPALQICQPSTPHPFPASQGVMLCHLCIKTYNPQSDRGL